MKKPIIVIVSLVLALALAGGAYIVLNNRNNNNGQVDTNQPISIGISGYNEYNIARDVKKMTITNPNGTFSFTPDPTVNGIDDKSWFLDDLDGIKSHAYAVNDIALAFYTITAAKKLEVSPEKVGDYGLNEPVTTVILEFNDGNTYSYSFGDALPITESKVSIASSETDTSQDFYCYLKRSGDDTTYLVESYYFLKTFITLKDVMTTELYPQLESGVIIQELNFSGTAGENLKIKNNAENVYDYYISEPYTRDVDSTAISALLNELDYIDTEDIYVVDAGTKNNPIPDDVLYYYGLYEPARILNFKYSIDNTEVGSDGSIIQTQEEGEHTIRMGIVINANVYVMIDDANAIYSVPYSLLSVVFEASFDSLAERNIYTEKLINIDEMIFDTDFKTFDYKLTSSTEVNSVTLNGKSIDVSAVKSLYTTFASIAYSERNENPPTAQPYMTITVKLTTGKTDVIRFTEFNSRRYYVTINGQGDLLISYELVDDLMTALKATDKGSLG